MTTSISSAGTSATCLDGGTVVANSLSVEANALLTFQGAAPYTFSGVNNLSGDGMPGLQETTSFLAE